MCSEPPCNLHFESWDLMLVVALCLGSTYVWEGGVWCDGAPRGRGVSPGPGWSRGGPEKG